MITFYAKPTMRNLTITTAALVLLASAAHADDPSEWHAYAAPFCAASEDSLRVLPALTHEGASKIVSKLEDGNFVIRWNSGTEHVARVVTDSVETCITAYNQAKLATD